MAFRLTNWRCWSGEGSSKQRVSVNEKQKKKQSRNISMFGASRKNWKSQDRRCQEKRWPSPLLNCRCQDMLKGFIFKQNIFTHTFQLPTSARIYLRWKWNAGLGGWRPRRQETILDAQTLLQSSNGAGLRGFLQRSACLLEFVKTFMFPRTFRAMLGSVSCSETEKDENECQKRRSYSKTALAKRSSALSNFSGVIDQAF